MNYKKNLEKQKQRFELILKNPKKFDFYMSMSNITMRYKVIENDLNLIKDIECINDECYNCTKKDTCPLGIKRQEEILKLIQ